MAWRARTMTAAAGAAALGASLMAGSAMAATPVDPGEMDAALTPVTIFNINDFHGRIDTDGKGTLGLLFACTLETAKAAAPDDAYLFLSAGDNIGATPFTSSSQDDIPTIKFLNALELEASAVGNHEFDRGFSVLTDDVFPLATFSYLGANVYEAGAPALQEYDIFEVNGVRIGVIGAVTQQTPTMVNPDGVLGLEFRDPVDEVNRVAAMLSDGVDAGDNAEADIIIAEYHEGAAVDSSLADATAASSVFASIVNETSADVDVIFNGHTHQEYTFDAPIPGGTGTRPVIQSGSYADPLGSLTLGIDGDGNLVEYTAENLPLYDDRTPLIDVATCIGDPEYDAAAAIVAAAVAEAAELGQQVVGEITDDITTAYGEDEDGVISRDDRQRESALGNLVAQVWLESMNEPGRPGADIGIMNPGGLRAELFYDTSEQGEGDGVVTYAEAYSVNPFANTLQTIDITGAQFKILLEQQWQPAEASRPFLKLGLSDNVRYTYDPDAPEGERITGIWFEGEPMDLDAVYTVAAGSFLIAGGDNFTVLRDGTNIKDSGQIDSDAFINYFLASDAVSPSWEKNGVAVDANLPVMVSAGGSATFEVSGIDLTSLGAPDNKTFIVYLGEREVGTATIETVHIDGVPTRDGLAHVTLKVPADFPVGDTVITLVAEESGTTVKLLAEVKAPTTGPVVETDIPAGGDAGSLGLLAGLLVAAAAGGLVVTRRRKVTDS